MGATTLSRLLIKVARDVAEAVEDVANGGEILSAEAAAENAGYDRNTTGFGIFVSYYNEELEDSGLLEAA